MPIVEDLVELATTNGSTTVYPSDDQLVQTLQARFRTDQPYTRVGHATLVAVNPLKVLVSVNDESAQQYEERSFRDTSLTGSAPGPHLYDTAARVYLLMLRNVQNQSVVFRGITGSGKTYTARLVTNQLLRLSTESEGEQRLAEQVKALDVVLDSFGCAKTFASPSASRVGRWTELHFNERGRIAGAQVLTWGLDKSRIVRPQHEERTFHVFYQFLAGASSEEHDCFNLEDPSEYALLASSGCYRLPGGPFSDDNAAMGELRAAFRTLGFKSKHVTAIQSVLVAVLLLGNLQFADPPAREEPARVANLPVLDAVAHHLGVAPDDLAQALTTRTNYVKRDAYNVFLDADRAHAQRDRLAMDLYSILFAFVVELANHKTAPTTTEDQPPPRRTQITLVDAPGYQTRAPSSSATLVSQHGQNGFDEFAIHFADELVHATVVRRVFDHAAPEAAQMIADGISLPRVVTMDNSACVELLRGARERGSGKPGGVIGALARVSNSYRQGKGSGEAADLVQDFVGAFGTHSSFVASPLLAQQHQDATAPLFGINHYAGSCTYDARAFVERDADVLDPALTVLLRASGEPFVAKLFSGPGLAAETHSKDPTAVVQAQVSSRPLHAPTQDVLDGEDGYAELDPSKVYSVGTQLNTAVSELLATLESTRMWTVLCIRPNDSGTPNSYDKQRARAQVRALLLPDWVRRVHSADWCVRITLDEFVAHCGCTPVEMGWREGTEYALGKERVIWLAFGAWKRVDDAIRAAEKDARSTAGFDGGSDAQLQPPSRMPSPVSDESQFQPPSRMPSPVLDGPVYVTYIGVGIPYKVLDKWVYDNKHHRWVADSWTDPFQLEQNAGCLSWELKEYVCVLNDYENNNPNNDDCNMEVFICPFAYRDFQPFTNNTVLSNERKKCSSLLAGLPKDLIMAVVANAPMRSRPNNLLGMSRAGLTLDDCIVVRVTESAERYFPSYLDIADSMENPEPYNLDKNVEAVQGASV